MDKEKALFREKENNYSRKINDIEKRLSEELLMSTRTIE